MTAAPATAAILPSVIPSSAVSTEIFEQFKQAVQAARADYQHTLAGAALREAQQGLERWQEISWAEIEYAMKNGENGNEVLQKYLADLEFRTQVNLKWAGYQERTPGQQKAALAAVEQYAGLKAAYQNSGLWPFNWMVMAETYRAGNYVYSIDVETDRIIEIEPVHDASIPAVGQYEPAEIGRKKAEAVIKRLEPGVDLGRLALKLDVSPEYYIWEDRAAPPLQDGQYPRIQVEYGPFINTLTAAP